MFTGTYHYRRTEREKERVSDGTNEIKRFKIYDFIKF